MKKQISLFFFALFLLLPLAQVQASSVSGRILLDVENNGEAYYINPLDQRKYFLGRPEEAFDLMKQFGLGISNENLIRFDRDVSFSSQYAGRILLQVEENGEAFYVHPVTLARHYLGRPANALRVMSEQGLGATSATIQSIPDGGDTSSVFNTVPFTAQAPFAEWDDLRQQEGCEEASVLMAMRWVEGRELTAQEAKDEILRMSDWQKQEFGYFEDTSVHDTAVRLFNRWFDYDNVSVENNIQSQDILEKLENGHLVIVATNGKKMNHSFYTPPGPDRHMMVVHSYDASTGEFLVHDPGTRYGADHRMTADELNYSLRDYPSGQLLPVTEERTAMIVIRK